MKPFIRHWHTLAVWMWALCLSGPAVAQTDSGSLIDKALERLAVTAALQQIDATVARQLHYRARQQQWSEAKTAAVAERVGEVVNQAAIARQVRAYLKARYDRAAFNRALQELDKPVAKRVRQYDARLSEPEQIVELQRYREKLQARAPLQSRENLVRDIDRAARISEMAALVQTGIAAAVDRAAGQSLTPAAYREQQRQRQAYLADQLLEVNLFSYRYLKGEELARYRAVLAHQDVQWVLELAMAALREALARPPAEPVG